MVRKHSNVQSFPLSAHGTVKLGLLGVPQNSTFGSLDLTPRKPFLNESGTVYLVCLIIFTVPHIQALINVFKKSFYAFTIALRNSQIGCWFNVSCRLLVM